MIKLLPSNIDSIKDQFYQRICNDTTTGAKGLITRVKNKLLLEANVKKVKFYYELLQDIKIKNGESIIISGPEYLERRKNYYQNKYSDILSDEKFRQEVQDGCFFYSSYEKWGAYVLARQLKVDTCPYCNRQYTFTLETDTGKTRPEFDHFIDKADFPYLSLSFYNLIPSCSICNSSLKGSNKFSVSTHLHPYLEGFSNDVKFSLAPFTVEFINGKPSSYKIKLKISKNADRGKAKRIGANMKVFKLHQLYNMHKDYVDEIIIKSRIYNSDYIISLYEQFKGELFSDLNDVMRMVVNNYLDEVDYGRRTLSKLSTDISKELKLI